MKHYGVNITDYIMQVPYVLAVHSIEQGLTGIHTKFDSYPFKVVIEPPFYQKGLKERKHRIDFCPDEDGRDLDNENCGVFGPIHLVAFSECEWVMQR